MIELPRLNIAHLPTPVEAACRSAEILKIKTMLIKRDDLTGLAFGGNKTRKLEFLLADAISHGALKVMTTGAVQSNHCRQTVAAAARCGLKCLLVLAGEKPLRFSGNLLLDNIMGAELVWCEPNKKDSVLEEKFQESRSKGEKPYLIPYGGSNPIGASAYVFAIKEMMEQGIDPDCIIFPSSSGGTQAGMLVGARKFGYSGKILGISVDKIQSEIKPQIVDLATRTAEFLGERMDFNLEDVIVIDDFIGRGYGIADKPERDAIQFFARHDGLLFDPVYTGRAAAGMLQLIRDGRIPKDNTVLFWHTGGTPALFIDVYQSLLSS